MALYFFVDLGLDVYFFASGIKKSSLKLFIVLAPVSSLNWDNNLSEFRSVLNFGIS